MAIHLHYTVLVKPIPKRSLPFRLGFMHFSFIISLFLKKIKSVHNKADKSEQSHKEMTSPDDELITTMTEYRTKAPRIYFYIVLYRTIRISSPSTERTDMLTNICTKLFADIDSVKSVLFVA